MTVQEATKPARAWVAPGPGHWESDDSHIAGTLPPYQGALFPAAATAGFRQGFRAYGVPLETIQWAMVGHRMYGQARPVGAPPPRAGAKASAGPPPAFVFKLLFRLHPELRYRRKQAAATFATRRWRRDYARWTDQDARRFRAANHALQQVDPAALDDAGLRAHLATLNQAFVQGVTYHFALIPATTVPVGDWIVRTREWTGAAPAELLPALNGASAASIATATKLDHLAAVIRQAPAALDALRSNQGTVDERLASLRASAPPVAAALDAYLDEFGWRIATGLSLDDKALIEMPDVLLKTIATSVDHPHEAAEDGPAVAARLRERVPAAHRAEYDTLLADARPAYGLRDDNVGVTILWPTGLLRRALLAAGQRLAARGALATAADIFEATPAEVAALLGGAGVPPTAADLAARAADRRAAANELAPAALGDAPGPRPPVDLFPPAMVRLTRAAMTFSGLMDDQMGSKAQPERAGLGGHPASAGRYEGRARIVLDPADFARVAPGDVLVARTTSPAYNILLPLLGAVVTDRGGVLCHAAVVAREFGIPAVVGTGTATTRIPDGARVLVDGSRGTVEIL